MMAAAIFHQQLLSIACQEEAEALRNAVQNAENTAQLCATLLKHSTWKELVASLLSCVRAAQGKDDAHRALQGVYMDIQMALLQHLSAETVCENDCEEIVALLVDQGQDSVREVGTMIQLALKAFDAGAVCALRLVPQLLHQPPSNYDADDNFGAFAKPLDAAGVVEHLVSAGWEAKHSARVLGLLRDVKMSKSSTSQLISSALKILERGDINDVPSTVHHALLMGCDNCLAEVLLGICALMGRLEAKCSAGVSGHKKLVEASGAVLIDIEMTIKLMTQGKTWMVQLVPSGTMAPFHAAVLLTLSSIPRLQQSAWSILKDILARSHHSSEHRQSSAWLGSLPQPPWGDADAIEAALVACVERCTDGWVTVIAPALKLAVELISSHTKKDHSFALSFLGDRSCGTSSERGMKLGMDLLTAIFAIHPPACVEILNTCQAKLIGATEAQSLPYLCVLGRLVCDHPGVIASHLPCLKASLDSMPMLDLNVARGLLLAIWPVCLSHTSAKEQLISILRKAMFKPDQDTRLLAVHGFLFAVLQELQNADTPACPQDDPSLSQVSLSQCSSLTAAGSGASLLQELAGFLRRSLTHQAAVRETLYNGILVVTQSDPLAQDAMLELLLPRLSQLFDTDESQPPLKLGTCVSEQRQEVRLVEPLADLLITARGLVEACLASRAMLSTGMIPAFDDAIQAMRAMLVQVLERLTASQLTDWGLDSSCNTSRKSTEGLLNCGKVNLLLGCLEVSLEDTIHRAALGTVPLEDAAMQMLKALALSSKLGKLLLRTTSKAFPTNENQAPESRKRIRGDAGTKILSTGVPPLHQRTTKLSAQCLVQILHIIAEDGALQRQEGHSADDSLSDSPCHALTALARDAEFQAFALQRSLSYLQACQHHQPIFGAFTGITGGTVDVGEAVLLPGLDWQKLGAPVMRTSQMIILACAGTAPSGASSKKKAQDASDSLPGLAVQCIAALFGLCRSTADLAQLLVLMPEPTGPGPDCGQGGRQLLSRLPHLRQLLLRLAIHGRSADLKLFCGGLMSLLAVLPTEVACLLTHWAGDASRACKDPQAKEARAIMDIFLHQKGANNLQAAKLVADAVLSILDPSSMQNPLQVVTEETVVSVGISLLSCLEGEVQLLDSLFGAFGACRGATALPDGLVCNDSDLSASAFRRAGEVCKIVSHLLNAHIPIQLLSAISRLILRTYKILIAATRLHIAPKGVHLIGVRSAGRTGPALGGDYRQLIDTVQKFLTPQVYDFIQSIQQPAQVSSQPSQPRAAHAKEERTIPDMVFQIEELERQLIQLSSKGGINLMRHAKRSTNRDWRPAPKG